MLQRHTKGNQLHFLIFERQTEEESVLTIAQLIKLTGNKISVFISSKIAILIEKDLVSIGIEPYILPDKLQSALNVINDFVKENPVDLIIFTRYSANTLQEHRLYKKFVSNYQVCSLIENYDRWFRKIPLLEFNGWKILKRSKINSWIFCKDIFNDFSCYFVSDIHTNSQNPFKKLIREKNNKPILDFPFKISKQIYAPNIEYKFPVFIIPGAVSTERRNYKMVLDIFSTAEIQQKEWQLILLGRPIGTTGEKILKKARQINKQYNNEKIVYFNQYIPKKTFDELMDKSTHIIAPVNENHYKYGKDSGAIYDVFKYNKIGIINDSYFYSPDLNVRQCVITHKNQSEFNVIVNLIIDKKYNYDKIKSAFSIVNSEFNADTYSNYLKKEFNEIFKEVVKNND